MFLSYKCVKRLKVQTELMYFTEQDQNKLKTIHWIFTNRFFASDYFSPERREVKSQHVVKPRIKKTEKHKSRLQPNVSVLSCSDDDGKTRDLDKEYDEMLKRMSEMRMRNMEQKLKTFDREHSVRLENIDKDMVQKQTVQTNSLLVEQSMQPTDEIEHYEALNQRKNANVVQNIQNVDRKLQGIQIQAKEHEERKRERTQKVKSLTQYIEPINKITARVKGIVNEFKTANLTLPQNFTLLLGQVSKEYNECMTVFSKALNKDRSENLDACIQHVNGKYKTLENLLKACEKQSVELKEKVAAEEKAKKEAAEKAKQTTALATTPGAVASTGAAASAASASSSQVLTLPKNLSIATAAPELASLEPTLRAVLSMCCPKPAFLEYLRLKKLLADVEKQHEPLNKSTEKAKKTYKFDLYKVVNTTINAVSDESPKHLLDKIIKMNMLLTGKDIETSGKNVNTRGSNEALLLCSDLLAKKLVLQGESQVSSSFKTAFPIAAFTVGVWTLFPDVGDLLLAHFFSKCPYLVPFYHPKSKNMSTVEYCKLVGYEVNGQEVESEDKYLKKMSGIVRLYAAILQTDVPSQLGNRNHPHGLQYGWTWFTRMLNLEPRPSVTATILFDFLEVAGHAMLKRYGKQFKKLLLILCQEYLPKIMDVTPANSKATVIRLKMFLDTCIKEGRIKEPEGRISAQWWST
ncbi:mRNA export factor GLE1-like isoform X2 [Hydractinia symbiolongicarpus]|uniref:mRNA export factor GLE1-like isoform X2 n=1 Tax=Hydractinia symbiolongicarpus TaxID=13093 RepID=UPI00254A738A|nr:mRNA export factor GLE1-like isoform X2 [Hydractinia symbiolongicarpus]